MIESIIYLMMYMTIGSLYLVYKYHKDELPEFWNFLQPISYVMLWPITFIVNLINKIRKP